ncbi:hypothetical protein ACUUL3_00735 [Thiovibrio sp. JS02]
MHSDEKSFPPDDTAQELYARLAGIGPGAPGTGDARQDEPDRGRPLPGEAVVTSPELLNMTPPLPDRPGAGHLPGQMK